MIKKQLGHIFFCIMSLFSASLFAQNLPKVAVISLDQPRNREIEDEVFETFDDAEINVVSSEEIEKRLKENQSPYPSEILAGEFVKMSTTVSKGVERFFYQSNRKAIKILQPIFDLGMTNLNVLGRRPDYADQIFQAAVLLIRSYESQKQSENQKGVIGLVVRNFPTQPFSASVIPPSVIKKLSKARDALPKNTTLQLVNQGKESSRCTPFVNGFKATLNQPIVVKGNTTFHVRLDCGFENPVVWKIYVPDGEKVELPITSQNPMKVGLPSDDRNSRRTAETALRAIMFWSKIDLVVGVAEYKEKKDENAKFLVLRIQKGKSPKWSDGAKKEDLYKALVRVFPELTHGTSPNENIENQPDMESSSTDWIGWSFVGAGVVSSGIATILLIDALDGQALLKTPKADQLIDKQAFADEIDRQVWISYGLYGVGAGLAGYGLFRILTNDSPQQTNLQLSPTLSPSRVGFQLKTDF